MQIKIQELVAYAEKLRFDGSEQIETYKRKYHDYKTKLKKANQSLQTITARLAKYELQLAAEREILRVDSSRKFGANIGSDFSGGVNPVALLHGHKSSGNYAGIRSSGSALSPAGGRFGNHPYDNFNIADYNNDIENHELNEEIKKLLMENQA